MVEEAREHESRMSDQIWEWRNTAVDKVLGILPRRTAEHLVNAQKEGILAVRSLLDRGIEALDGDLRRVHERPPRH
jgi:hypothetical protein